MKNSPVHKWLNSYFVFGDTSFDSEKLFNLLAPPFTAKIKQVHGVDGLVINKKNFDFKSYKPVEADFIITNKSGVFLPIKTADCLPIFLYNSALHVIGAVHAGWRGSVAGVLDHAIERMKTEFETSVENLQLIFGPSAKNCCYGVKDDCIEIMRRFDSSDVLDNALIIRDSLFYFDLFAYNRMRAYNKGILNQNIHVGFSCCTICTGSFFSCRKQGKDTGRNISGIMLL